MSRLNRRGVGFEHYFVDIAVVFIFVLIVVFWWIVLTAYKENVVMQITEKENIIRDTQTFINILRLPVDEKTNVADLIVDKFEHIGDAGYDDSILKGKISSIVNALYKKGADRCWTLYYGDGDQEKPLIFVECAGSIGQNPFIDTRVVIPMKEDKIGLLLRFVVPSTG